MEDCTHNSFPATYQSFIRFSGTHVDYIRRAKTIWASNRLLFLPASFSGSALRSLSWCLAVIISRGRMLCSRVFLSSFFFLFFRPLGARSSSFRCCFLVTAVGPLAVVSSRNLSRALMTVNQVCVLNLTISMTKQRLSRQQTRALLA